MRVFKLIIIILFSSTALTAEYKIDYTNSDKNAQHLIESYLKHHQTNNLPDSINNLLTEHGYLGNKISLSNISILEINAGPRFNLGRLIIRGDSNDSLKCNIPFTQKRIDGLIDSVINRYQKRGYYFAAGLPVEYTKNGTNIDMYISMNTGPVLTVSSIEFEGLHRTNPELIKKFLQLKSGDTLLVDLVDKSESSFKRLNFVALIDKPKIIPDPGYTTARLLYRFVEGRQFNFEGAAGYVPDDNGYFMWYLDFKGQNIFGSGQKGGLFVDKRERDRSVFDIYYGQPIFLLGMGEAAIRLKTRDYREQFYEFGAELSYNLWLQNNMSFRSILAWKNVEPSSDFERSFQSWETGLGLKFGYLKNSKNVRELSVDWLIKYSGRRYKKSEETPSIKRAVYNDTRNKLNVAGSMPLFAFVTEFHRLTVKDVESSEKPLPFSELFLLGGPTTLRGYRNDQFFARRMIVLQSELRFFVSVSNYFYPFIDGAYFEFDKSVGDSTIMIIENTVLGYGLGMALLSGNYRLQVELSWGEETPFDEPRLNVVIGSLF